MRRGCSLLIDCGANVDARPSHLVQFAKMGSVYMESVMGIPNPRVAIVNIGAEEEKGNALVKETFPLLKNCPEINFIGSIEARDIPTGYADVIVCEAFAGNIILKLYEGVGAALIKKVKAGMMTSLRSKIGGLLVKPALKETLKEFSVEEYGGAPLLGLNGLVVKTHGSSKAIEIKNSVLQCVTFKEQRMEFEALKKVAATVLGMDPDEIEMDMTFLTDLGADSLDLYQIFLGVQEETGLHIPTEGLDKLTTVREAVEWMERAGKLCEKE